MADGEAFAAVLVAGGSAGQGLNLDAVSLLSRVGLVAAAFTGALGGVLLTWLAAIYFLRTSRSAEPPQWRKGWHFVVANELVGPTIGVAGYQWALKTTPSSLGTAALRLTFLAEGLVALSRDGVKVDSLDDLLAKLRDRNFSTEVSVHGRTEKMEVNETILVIPKDELADAQPDGQGARAGPPRDLGADRVEHRRRDSDLMHRRSPGLLSS